MCSSDSGRRDDYPSFFIPNELLYFKCLHGVTVSCGYRRRLRDIKPLKIHSIFCSIFAVRLLSFTDLDSVVARVFLFADPKCLS